MGENIVKAIRTAEFLRKTVCDLYIGTEIISIKFKDTYKPLFEGLIEVTSESYRSALLIRFSFSSKGIVNTPGYQQGSEKPSKTESDSFLEKARNFN